MEKPLLELIKNEVEDEDFDLYETVLDIAGSSGWNGLMSEALGILSEVNLMPYWRSAICVIYWAMGSEVSFPVSKMEVVARLYRCLVQFPGLGGEGLSDGENLVWSIAIELKGVRYDSEWVPQLDPEVRTHLALMD